MQLFKKFAVQIPNNGYVYYSFPTGMTMKKKQEFETKLKRLEEIAAELDTGETGLEEAVSLYEEGIKLVKELETVLSGIERRITLAGSEAPLADVDDSSTEKPVSEGPTLF